MDTDTAYAEMNMTLSEIGRYFIRFEVTSQPPEYDITITSSAIDVVEQSFLEEGFTTHRVMLTMDYNYNTYVAGEEDYFTAAVMNTLIVLYGNVTFSNVQVYSGKYHKMTSI